MKKRLSLLAIFLFLSVLWLQSQQRIRLYDVNQGLCGNFVYTIFQDQNGFLWAGTGNGLCRFDGSNFVSNITLDSIPRDFVSISFIDRQGNIWMGHNDGSLTFYDGKHFKIVSPAEKTMSKIVGITEDSSGRIYAASQRGGVIVVNNDLVTEYHKDEFSDFPISSIALLNEGKFLLGSFEGLFSVEFNNNLFTNREKVEAVSASNIQVINYDKPKGIIYLGTQYQGLIAMSYDRETDQLSNISLPEDLSQLNIQDILPEENGRLWLSTFGDGLIQIQFEPELSGYKVISRFNSENGLPGDNVKQFMRDFEGNMWIATYDGLVYITNETFTLIPDFGDKFGANVLSIASFGDLIYLGGSNGVLAFPKEDSKTRKFWGKAEGMPEDGITGLVADKDGNLYIGTATSGIYFKPVKSDRVRLFHASQNSPANIIHFLKIVNGTLWAATNSGVLSFSLPDNKPEIFNTEYGLPHNSVRHIFVDSDKDVWVSTKGNRIFSITNQEHIQVADIELDFSTITVDKKGRMWAATMGTGVILLKNDTLIQFTSDEGLLSNYCYSLACDIEGNIWVGHRLGVSRINEDNYKIRTFGNEIGISGDCNYNALLNTPSGDLYIGTTRGLLIYHSDRVKEIPPPKPNITAVYISDQLVDHTKPIRLPYGAYKLRIEYTGISFSDPEKVTYQYKLDGYDLDWSPIVSEKFALYPRIDDGDFTFLLVAFNADGVPAEQPLELVISVKIPMWKQTWFWILALVIAVLAVILIIRIRERAHKLRQKYLEEELEKRSKEIIVKNVELEKKNNDITDSINYAKRIQGSILPPIHKIEMQFPGSFVFYRPRDIVSGDFYWFDKVNDNKFLIVCADSTGHGVPGAFMSMIGTTLIKDICMRSNVQSPSDVLSMLDYEIASMLNVQDTPDSQSSTDGMDLTVCELDLNTKYLRFASAMRPIMLYHKNELLYLRGSRNAIGGHLGDSKEFDNQGYQLEKGDIIYMFTDGYPDQFGGPFGKKYKIVRLKNLLNDICSMPVEKQELMIVNEFNNWKGDQDQVDDVLFMCIKI